MLRLTLTLLWLCLTAAVGVTQAAETALTLRLVGGDGHAGFRDSPGAQFNKPIRLAAFDGNSVLVADIFNHAIRAVRTDGTVTTIAGNPEKGHRDGPAEQALFSSPHGVAVSPAGVIAVAEAEGHTIRLITPGATVAGQPRHYEVSTLAGVPGVKGMRDGAADQALFSSPHAVAFAADGSVLVMDIGNLRVRRISKGTVTTVAGPSAMFVGPIDLAVAGDGAVVIADAGNGQILRWTAAAGLQTVPVNEPLKQPHGIAVAGDGSLFVSEIGSNRVVRISKDGSVTRVAGTGTAGSGPQELNRPAAVLVDRGVLWIADLDNHRIMMAPLPAQAPVL